MEEEDEIVVDGRRPSESEVDWSFILSMYTFDFGWLTNWGLEGGGQAPAPEEPEEPEEIVVTASRPSPGQEEFDDDGDVFNDGAAPTISTLLAWLEDMEARGYIDSFGLIQRDPNDPDAGYDGQYSTIDGSRYEFESDGQTATNFLRSYVLPEPEPPIDPRSIAFDGGDYWLL